MKRRDLFALIGGAAAWPLAVRAQQPMPMIGYLYTGTRALNTGLPGFPKGLQQAGFVEGKNVTIAYRFADGRNDRLPELAADLARSGVGAIFAGDNASAFAAKAATLTIPVVFWVGGDPVKMGLVASLGRPGGNVTGVSGLTIALLAKKVQLLHDMIPALSGIGLLVNPANPGTPSDSTEATEAARARGLKLHIASATSEDEIAAAFEMLVQEKAGALILQGDPFMTTRITQIIEAARRHHMPVTYYLRSHVEAGGLMSYAPSILDLYREAATYVGRILKGEKPAELPVQLAARLELVINRKTADALNLVIPPQVEILADKVIE
jgi:putative tryptophan/tyrosine transport system substrate-binding protein